MKLTLLEVSNNKKIKNNKNRLYQINTSLKKNNLSNNIRQNNWKTIKYNLLHKKNLKEININFQKAKNIILSDKVKNTYDKKNINNINTTNNMNIIENSENILDKNNNNNNVIKLSKKKN